jgi:hypothetical protein
MIGKRLLTVSLLLPFMVISSLVHADATPSKKRHWPNELRDYSFRQGSALNRVAPRAQVLPEAESNHGLTTERCAYQYQGGPKSSLWTCRR